MQNPPTEPIGMAVLCVVILLGGFAGGAVDLLHKISYKDGKFSILGEIYNKTVFFLLLLRSGSVGIGGALGLCAVRIYAGEFRNRMIGEPAGIMAENILYNFALSVIAGFAARTLLPNIASRLERHLQEQDRKIDDQQNHLREAEKLIHEQKTAAEETGRRLREQQQELEIQRAYTSAMYALTSVSIPSDHQRAKEALIELVSKVPTDRKATILLGRLYNEKLGDVLKAISIFDAFLRAKIQAGSGKDKDYADVLYNRACYLVQHSKALEGTEGNDSAQKVIADAAADLRSSIELSPENRQDAAADPDFDSVRQLPEFASLC